MRSRDSSLFFLIKKSQLTILCLYEKEILEFNLLQDSVDLLFLLSSSPFSPKCLINCIFDDGL